MLATDRLNQLVCKKKETRKTIGIRTSFESVPFAEYIFYLNLHRTKRHREGNRYQLEESNCDRESDILPEQKALRSIMTSIRASTSRAASDGLVAHE